jgi:hypothetical protein
MTPRRELAAMVEEAEWILAVEEAGDWRKRIGIASGWRPDAMLGSNASHASALT